MKKKLFIIEAFAAILLSMVCCTKDELTPKENSLNLEQIDDMQIEFAKTLAKGLANSYELRNLIKSEALKLFNNDFDILYQLIREKKIEGMTVSEFLSDFADSKEDFNALELRLPLLTIFVPELPDFSAETWDVSNEIPKVGVRLTANSGVPLIDESGNMKILPSGHIPGYPAVVVKQNERVVLDNSTDLKSTSKLAGSMYNFRFKDDCFDPSKNEGRLKRTARKNNIDQRIVKAYEMNMSWQRDYIYYGLTPTNTTGTLRTDYAEYIKSFRMVNLPDTWFPKITDQIPDPYVIPYKKNSSDPTWTEGNYEFKIVVLNNSTSGTGSTFDRYLAPKGSDLLDVTYTRYGNWLNGYYYIATGFTTKTWPVNLELDNWDLKSTGTAWKLTISEEDASEVYTVSFENSTVYATNFKVGSGGTSKVGLEFGGSTTTTNKSSFTLVKTLASDQLGDCILHFYEPIIIDIRAGYYETREISSGWVSLSVEPQYRY